MLFKPFSNLKFSLQLLSVSEVGAGAFSHAEVVNNDFSNQWGIMNLMEMWIKTYELCGATLRCFFGGLLQLFYCEAPEMFVDGEKLHLTFHQRGNEFPH